MPLHANSQFLVNELESLPLLSGRFSKLKLVNYDSIADQKRGCFSLVFSAVDDMTGEQVALKFFDLHPALLIDKYRREAFEREQEILKTLINKNRCLQLVQQMEYYDLNINNGSGPPFTYRCSYFAVQWIKDDIDEYFLNSGVNAIEKLRLFNETVLAVEALHRNQVFHRDLKVDNFRALKNSIERCVIAIDLGAAARFASGFIKSFYGESVGASGYAGPEAICGLAGNRELAKYTDIYALGCLLYELFNSTYFFCCLEIDNPNIGLVLAAMTSHLTGATTDSEQKAAWRKALSIHGGGISPSVIDGAGSTAPAGIVPILNEVLAALTHFDYDRRPKDLESVRRKIWSAIRTLQNQKFYTAKLDQQREQRRRREEKLRLKELRLHQNTSRQVC